MYVALCVVLSRACGGGVGSSAGSHPACSWVKFSIRCPRLDDRQEEVYEDLCYVTFSPRSSLDEVSSLSPLAIIVDFYSVPRLEP